MKIYVSQDNNGRVIDNIVKDFKKYSSHTIVNNPSKSDLIWVTSPWSFQKKYASYNVPVFLQIHHVETSKLKEYNFKLFDKCVKGYIVPNHFTYDVVKRYVNKPVNLIPYWLLSKTLSRSSVWKIKKLKKEIGDYILIGSFQKDSVFNTARPKLCKGPDVFLSVIKKLCCNNRIKVVLTCRSRKYLIENFISNKIPYVFFENYKDINSLYDVLDWYFVTSRIEGGPQSILECSYRKVKILSTNVGMADVVLHPDCICKLEQDFIESFNKSMDRREENFSNVMKYLPDKIIPEMDGFFERNLE